MANAEARSGEGRTIQFARWILVLWALYNLLVFAIYAWDKRRAQRGGWRVPEARLLRLALYGGGPGAFVAIFTLRHKSRKRKFTWGVSLISILQIAGAFWGVNALLR